MSDFKSFDLLPTILKAVEKLGYTEPTPIQEKCIPHLIEGRDLLGIAQTGTGKTAAFCLPILNYIKKNKFKVKAARVRVLVLTPTRELATQIEKSFRDYGKGLCLNSKVIFGGVGYRPQVEAMSKGLDIVVATPGRLLDLITDGHVLFEQLEVFVLDEADRMLDLGFFKEVKQIIAKLPEKRQTLLFSATMPDDISDLASSLLIDPVRVEVAPPSTTAQRVEQRLNMVAQQNKPLLLKSILKDKTYKSILVFCRTKHGADRVARHLDKAGVSCAAIHGNKSQGGREKALGGFRVGKIRVLVATDIAARGIDVAKIDLVINYDLPSEAESYVHRIGRTARAGESGIAISFCDESETRKLKNIQKLVGEDIPEDKSHPYYGVEPKLDTVQQGKRGGKPIKISKKKQKNKED